MMYYGYGMFKGERNPHHIDPYDKFNPLQRMLYQILMLFLLPLQFATGLLMWDVKRFSGVIDMVGGVRVVDTVHVLIFIFFVFYMCFHPYLATLGHTPTAHIKAMITGYEDVDDERMRPTGGRRSGVGVMPQSGVMRQARAVPLRRRVGNSPPALDSFQEVIR